MVGDVFSSLIVVLQPIKATNVNSAKKYLMDFI